MGFLPPLIGPGGRPYVFFFGFSNPSGDTSWAIGPNKFQRVWNRSFGLSKQHLSKGTADPAPPPRHAYPSPFLVWTVRLQLALSFCAQRSGASPGSICRGGYQPNFPEGIGRPSFWLHTAKSSCCFSLLGHIGS